MYQAFVKRARRSPFPVSSTAESPSLAERPPSSWWRPTGWSVSARIWNVTRSPSVTSRTRRECTSGGMMEPYSFPSLSSWYPWQRETGVPCVQEKEGENGNSVHNRCKLLTFQLKGINAAAMLIQAALRHRAKPDGFTHTHTRTHTCGKHTLNTRDVHRTHTHTHVMCIAHTHTHIHTRTHTYTHILTHAPPLHAPTRRRPRTAAASPT